MSQEEALEFSREQMEELLGRATQAINMSQETDGVMEAAEESIGSRSVYQSFHGIFSEICKNVTTVEAWMEVRRALHVVNSSVMQMAAEADKNKGLEGVSSLPATRNSARKKKRKKRPHEK